MDILTVVAMPLVTAAVGFTINSSLNARQARENNLRLYADMMTRREQADSDLRKDMFTSILDKFTTAGSNPTSPERLEQQVVNLELLAANFNESLDLGPLFEHLRRQIPKDSDSLGAESRKVSADLRKRLETVASEIGERQIRVLAESGVVVRAGAGEFEHPAEKTPYLRFLGPTAILHPDAKPEDSVTQVCLTMSTPQGPHARRFKVEISDYNADAREFQVRLYASKVLDAANCAAPDLDLKGAAEIDTEFWVGTFDFPMVDNTRLSQGERCAVVLTDLGPGHAGLTLTYFPGSRASLKDKPYYDEIEQDLRTGSRVR